MVHTESGTDFRENHDDTTPGEIFFGGTFDPIHIGHLMIASEACEILGCRRVLFVPAGQNPLKKDIPGASGSHRLAMVRLAIAGDTRFSASSREIERDGPSRTFDTVRTLIQEGALITRPWIVIGEELLPNLDRWYRIDDLLKQVRLAVVGRPGEDRCDDRSTSPLPEAFTSLTTRTGTTPRFIGNPRLRLSATELRERLFQRRIVRYLVPDSVYGYIEEHRLYRQRD
ncbi:MAG: nicotinate (nicotinamide) nucleotide adenylyltransferase [Alkalispirochaeta sp.]